MTAVGGVGGRAPHFPSLDDGGADPVSLGGELAVLMLETQELRKQIDHERLASAREDFRDALDDEVQLLKDAADATRRGALLQAGLGVVGCGTSIYGLAVESEKWSKAGDGLSQLAKPMGDLLGTSYGAAEAKAAEGLQQAAKWEIEDCRDSVRDADALQNKALDWVSSLVERDAAAMAAILSNKA